MLKEPDNLSPAKEIAYIAVTCAMLIGVQLALYALPGVECVTVLLLCTSYAFGARFGFMTGLAFSLLRCILFGFYPSVIILYCIYFPLFGLLFGALGKADKKMTRLPFKIAVNIILIFLSCTAYFVYALDLIKISRIYKETLDIFLCVLCALFLLLLVSFDGIWIYTRATGKSESVLKLFVVVTLAAVCTICFTLIDDVITPLVIGMTAGGALTYFYASFTAMLPQTVCTIATVGLLFYPLTEIFKRAKR